MAKIIDLGHGAGGIKMHSLIRDMFGSRFAEHVVANPDDSAVMEESGLRIAFTTDSYVVRPLFFHGGDIGRLSVCGTVNDLAMVGATPRWISVAMVIEEGLEESILERISDSIGKSAREAGVSVVTGDTKVVDRGGADGLFITTSGVGFVPPGVVLSGKRVRPGMAVIISGTVGDHEIAVLNAREGLVETGGLASDCAPLNELVVVMLKECPEIVCMRDPTRGGLATTLNEIAMQSGVGIEIEEDAVPIRKPVRGLCDLLGLDPFYAANEGKLIAVLEEAHAERLLGVMKDHPLGRDAAVIGRACPARAVKEHPGSLVLITPVGGRRILDMLAGRPIPRIC